MIKFRLYYDKDKEENWLNEMAARGYVMENFFLGFYRFRPCKKGEYIYQIELFTEDMIQADYVNLIEETGAEYITQWFWWRYFRRKAELGEFKLYTDASSQVEQYQRIFRFFRWGAILETFITVWEFWLTGINWHQMGEISAAMILCCILVTAVAGVLWLVCYRTKKKIRQLEEELV